MGTTNAREEFSRGRKDGFVGMPCTPGGAPFSEVFTTLDIFFRQFGKHEPEYRGGYFLGVEDRRKTGRLKMLKLALTWVLDWRR